MKGEERFGGVWKGLQGHGMGRMTETKSALKKKTDNIGIGCVARACVLNQAF